MATQMRVVRRSTWYLVGCPERRRWRRIQMIETGMRTFHPNHELVVAQAGSVPRSQMNTKGKTKIFPKNHSSGHQPRWRRARWWRWVRASASRREQRRDRRHVDHVDVLGEEEHRPAQAGVLGVEAGDELALGLGRSNGARLVSPTIEIA